MGIAGKRKPSIRRVLRVMWVCVFVALFASSVVFADDTDPTTDQFHHSVWMPKDGAPADIWAMIQSKEGYLLLGTGSGLYRFDGARFERFTLPSGDPFPPNNITSLMQLPNGDTWVGFFSGGASVIRGDRIVKYTQRDGFPDAMVLTFAQESDGTLWAATMGGPVRFENGRWRTIGKDWNYPATRADWLLLDSQGTLWVTTGETLLFLRKGSRHFESTGMEVGKFATLAIAPNDFMWISDGLHGTRALPGLSASQPHVDDGSHLPQTSFAQAKRLLFDRKGRLWITDAVRGGVYQVASLASAGDGRSLTPEDVTAVFNQKGGLTSDIAVPIVQDREGTIWVGTNLGLNSFRRNSLTVLPEIAVGPSSNFGLAADSHGVVWVANQGSLFRLEHASPVQVMHGLPEISAAFAGSDDVLWLFGKDLFQINNGLPVKVPLLEGEPPANIRAIASDRAGGLWASYIDKGLYHLTQGKWVPWQPKFPFAALTPASITTDSEGRVWLGYSDSRLALLDGTVLRTYSPQDGLQVGNVNIIDASTKDALIGGESGLARFRNGHIQSLTSQDFEVLSGISGIVQLKNGDVWLNTSKGIVHIEATEFQRAFDHPGDPFAYKVFDYQDGLPGIARQSSITPTAMADAEGRLWFATNQGIAWIDPARIRINTSPPPMAIRSLIAMGKSYLPSAALALPKHTTNVQIQYTAMSLSNPERVHFRYKLDGVDAQWQDVGNRREAFYSNLGPGNYHFRVIAANDDGVWNNQGALMDFTIVPLFYQTRWFTALCVLGGLLAVLALFLYRLRRMEIQIQQQLEERHAERERIARELHDTLLQAIQGLVLRFQVVAGRIPENDPTRAMIEKALDRADDVLLEGRDRVRDLRTAAETTRDLPQAFASIAEELSQVHPAKFRVDTKGPKRMLDPFVREEVYRIGREALINAFQHAQASAIEVEINHDPAHLRLRVRDDGVGIDPQLLQPGGKPGHWGLKGMHERATRIGAKLDIWRGPGSGTELDLQVPAVVAYRGSSRSFLNWLRRIVSGGRYG